jgi:hypothetical protein
MYILYNKDQTGLTNQLATPEINDPYPSGATISVPANGGLILTDLKGSVSIPSVTGLSIFYGSLDNGRVNAGIVNTTASAKNVAISATSIGAGHRFLNSKQLPNFSVNLSLTLNVPSDTVNLDSGRTRHFVRGPAFAYISGSVSLYNGSNTEFLIKELAELNDVGIVFADTSLSYFNFAVRAEKVSFSKSLSNLILTSYDLELKEVV